MSVFNLSFEVALSLGSPRSFTGKHFIKDYSNGPDVAFETVHVLIEGFERHVDWRADVITALFFDVFLFDCKSKISNFGLSIDEKYIGRLEITMNNAIFVDPSVSIDYLFEYM